MEKESPVRVQPGGKVKGELKDCRKFCAVVPEPNPTIASFKASVVKIYNTSGSLVRFGNINYFLLL
jgi:hypothetical protein